MDGQAFVLLNAEALRDLGVSSVGQRLAILKAIYHLKIRNNIPIEEDDYVPPCKHSEQEHRPSFNGVVFTSRSSSSVREFDFRKTSFHCPRARYPNCTQVASSTELVSPPATRLRSLEDDNRHLNNLISSFTEDLNNIRTTSPRSVRTCSFFLFRLISNLSFPGRTGRIAEAALLQMGAVCETAEVTDETRL